MTEWYPAPAKINLFLHVVGRRPDGYHLLQTAFRFLDHGDRLAFEPRSDGRVCRIEGPAAVPEDADLVVRAARLLQQAAGTGLGVDIRVDKRLPFGGGVGGGSSDAATTLLVLNRLWKCGLDRDTLQSLGLGLGADVPVFIYGRSSFAEGVGERLRPIDLPPAWYVVLVPPVQVSTGAVFSHPELTRDTSPITMAAFFSSPTRNDLEPLVRRLHPEVDRAAQWLSGFGPARMTGSGACVFCGFDQEEQARNVWSRRPKEFTGFVARGVDVHPLHEWVV